MSKAEAKTDADAKWDGTDGRLQFEHDGGEPVYIDTLTGDDRNDGRSATTALRTYTEYFRRWTTAPDAHSGSKSVNVVVVDRSRSEEEIAMVLARKQALVAEVMGGGGSGVALIDSCEGIRPGPEASEISGTLPVRMNRAMRRAKASQARKKSYKGGVGTIILHDPNARHGGGR